ncbi:unnamed protein product [Chrysoparadoxa australica]
MLTAEELQKLDEADGAAAQSSTTWNRKRSRPQSNCAGNDGGSPGGSIGSRTTASEGSPLADPADGQPRPSNDFTAWGDSTQPNELSREGRAGLERHTVANASVIPQHIGYKPEHRHKEVAAQKEAHVKAAASHAEGPVAGRKRMWSQEQMFRDKPFQGRAAAGAGDRDSSIGTASADMDASMEHNAAASGMASKAAAPSQKMHPGEVSSARTHAAAPEAGVPNRRCIYKGCDVWATFAAEGKKPIYCAKHKVGQMLDVKNRRCSEKGCRTRPTFGYAAGFPQRCSKHKVEGMMDVKNRHCEEPNCNKRPSYGFAGAKPTRCARHSVDGMTGTWARSRAPAAKQKAKEDYRKGGT